MKLLITGASGFLGQYVVAAALRRGHHVRAGVRGRSPLQDSLTWQDHPNLEVAKVDLLQRETLLDAAQGVDAVIHLAATMKGDFQAQYAGTVTATENLLSAMQDAGISRLVAISSFSVFDYLNLPDGATIEESSPLEQNPAQRDAYTQTKLDSGGNRTAVWTNGTGDDSTTRYDLRARSPLECAFGHQSRRSPLASDWRKWSDAPDLRRKLCHVNRPGG